MPAEHGGGEAVAAAATAHDDSEWVTRFSDDHGANYYKHRVTGETRWEMPAEHGGGKRIAADGHPYTMEEFVAHYGGTVEWLAAEPYVP